MTKKYVLIFYLLFTAQFLFGQVVKILGHNQSCSIRGLSVVDNKVAWISGSKGHVAKTTNGCKTWNWQQVKGFEQSDFRDIEAFSAKEAIIMSSGAPALILKTADGGLSWKVVYRNDDKAYFLDAMAFSDLKTGYVLGDPINSKFLLLETKDSGKNWKPLPNAPAALPGEAAFAASGTCISANGSIGFVTGGSNSRLITSDPSRLNWSGAILPINQGNSSKGAFSIALGNGNIVIVGGDYANNKAVDSVACYADFKSRNKDFRPAQHNPAGYQSGITYLKGNIFLSTGTSGTNITIDGGKNWKQIDIRSFNVCQKAKNGNLVLLAGDRGLIAVFKNH